MTVKSAMRVFDLIELFAQERAPITLSAIAAHLEVPVSSTHGLIGTLVERGYLFQPKKRHGYYPTLKLKKISDSIAEAIPLGNLFAPRLAELRDETGETVLLTKKEGNSVINLEAYESNQSIRFSPVIGEIKPLHSTASGKAMLGSMPGKELARILERIKLDWQTKQTITDPDRLVANIALGRKQGWYQIVGEQIDELMSIAVPLRCGAELYAIVIGGPTQRIRPKLGAHVGRLQMCCTFIQCAAAADGWI